MRLNLVFLGKRGAGSEFLRGGARFAVDHNIELSVFYSLHNVDVNLNEFLDNKFPIPLPHSLLNVFWHPIKLARNIWNIRKVLGLDTSINIFLLPSPFDWTLYALNNKKNSWYFIIHDSTTHLGEIWPNKRSIAWRVKASKKIVTLSEYVSREISGIDPGKTVVTIPHPVFKFSNNLETWDSPLPPKYILFVGRIRAYKGLDILFEAMKRIDSVTLLVAGEGEVPSNELKNVFVLNEWLGENQIFYLMQNALCVVFPYREASQSGLLPLAMSLKKKIVATDVGALAEQLGTYTWKYLATPADVESLVTGIQMALADPTESALNELEEKLVEKSITLERFFQELFKFTLN